jgi:hypothetical protein
MAVNRIEAIVDILAQLNGAADPLSECYQIRNPLLMRSFARPGKHFVDDKGRRVFPSWLAGYKAAMFDLELKISGHSRAGLKPDDTLTNLLGVYGMNNPQAMKRVTNFLKRALSDEQINAHTPLSYFLCTDVNKLETE